VSSDWRKYSDEQWMRLGVATDRGAPVYHDLGYRLAFCGFVAPFLLLGAFLASPVSPIGVPAKEKDMKSFRPHVAAVSALITGSALAQSSTTVVWGRISEGQASVPPALQTPVQISAGLYHSLAIDATGRVFAWG
jgi:hypothetical protein